MWQPLTGDVRGETQTGVPPRGRVSRNSITEYVALSVEGLDEGLDRSRRRIRRSPARGFSYLSLCDLVATGCNINLVADCDQIKQLDHIRVSHSNASM